AGFIQAIQQNPQDQSLLLVYADWLDERGDVRADYLRLVPQLAEQSARDRFNTLSNQIDMIWRASIERSWIKARLGVVRGLRMGVEYSIFEGTNRIGSSAPWIAQPAELDIDLAPQEPFGAVRPSPTWAGAWGSADDPARCYPEHALITSEGGLVFVEA